MTQKSKYKEWAIPAVGAVAVLSLGLFATGCGGGGGSSATTSSGSVTASVGDGPVSGATVKIYDKNGTQISTGTTNTYGDVVISITPKPATTSYPLKLVVVPGTGTDLVSGKTNDVPLMGIIADSTKSVGHITPLTTLIVKAAEKKAGGFAKITATDLSTTRDKTVHAFGGGSLAGVDVLNGAVATIFADQYTAATFATLNEGIGELFRRIGVSNDPATDKYIAAMAEDIYSDGLLDGYNGSSVISGGKDTYAVTYIQKNADVQGEIAADALKITGANKTVTINNVLSQFDGVIKTGTGKASDLKGAGVASTAKQAISDNYTNVAKTTAAKVKAAGKIDATVKAAAKAGIANVVYSIYTGTTNPIKIVDDYANTSWTVTGASVSNGVLSMDLYTSTNSVSAAGLLKVVQGSSTKSPYAEITVKNVIKKASTTSTITAEVFDIGTNSTGNFTRESGEGYVKAVYDVTYKSADGTTLTLTAAANGTASVNFTNRANTAGTATLTNSAANVVSVNQGGTANGAQTIKIALGQLFTLNNNALVTAFKGVATMSGKFAIRIKFTNLAIVTDSGDSVTSIEMIAQAK